MKEEQVQSVREFNRFYTNVIGLLDNHLLDSQFSFPEARILYELGQHQPCTASDIMAIVTMDRGYMSRILTQFEKQKIVVRKKSPQDGRVYFLTLTPSGKKTYRNLDRSSHRQIEALLKNMNDQTREKLLHHMNEIQTIFASATN